MQPLPVALMVMVASSACRRGCTAPSPVQPKHEVGCVETMPDAEEGAVRSGAGGTDEGLGLGPVRA